MDAIFHHGANEAKASAATREVRWTHPLTCFWASTTQVWSWDGGDAIVLVVGDIRNARSVVVLRNGDKVHVVEGASLRSALEAYGLNASAPIKAAS